MLDDQVVCLDHGEFLSLHLRFGILASQWILARCRLSLIFQLKAAMTSVGSLFFSFPEHLGSAVRAARTVR